MKVIIAKSLSYVAFHSSPLASRYPLQQLSAVEVEFITPFGMRNVASAYQRIDAGLAQPRNLARQLNATSFRSTRSWGRSKRVLDLMSHYRTEVIEKLSVINARRN